MLEEVKKYPDFFSNRGNSQRRIDFAVFRRIRKPCAELIRQLRETVATMPPRFRWRAAQIEAGWRFVELTLDAADAMATYRRTSSVTDFNHAIELGAARRKFMLDKRWEYALSPESADESERHGSTGILHERPRIPLPQLKLRTAGELPVIDGKTKDPAWKKFGVLIGGRDAPFRNSETGLPVQKGAHSSGWILRGGDGLYVLLWASEPEMDKLIVNDNPSTLWKGDCFEIFLAPGGGDLCYQFIVNPRGSGSAYAYRGDMGLDRNYRPRWKYAANRFRNGWAIEVFIAWSALGWKTPPPAGTILRGNFCRERYTGIRENSAWAPTGGPFRRPERFGLIVLQ
ncbi:MAG: hypothetical protein D6820_10540 [Lentisphaerae bacterium]|nr:MAG: hypothetical protein D6820_10540 [Lentisphaerota bacterium]